MGHRESLWVTPWKAHVSLHVDGALISPVCWRAPLEASASPSPAAHNAEMPADSNAMIEIHIVITIILFNTRDTHPRGKRQSPKPTSLQLNNRNVKKTQLGTRNIARLPISDNTTDIPSTIKHKKCYLFTHTVTVIK